MKKIFLFFLAAGLVAVSCNNKSKSPGPTNNSGEKDNYLNGKEGNNENTDNKTEWSASDVRRFNEECQKSMEKEGVDQSITDKVCPCVLEKVSARYASFSEADERGNTSVIEKMTTDCASELGIGNNNSGNNNGNNSGNTGSSQWTSKDVNDYVDNCVSSAVQSGMDRNKAQNYCSCMQQKFEASYPNPQELVQLSEDEIMNLSKRYATQCLRNN